MNTRVMMEKAKQDARVKMLKLLEQNMETMLETLEEVADDCLHDAGFRADYDDQFGQAMDEWIGRQTEVIAEAVHFWHAREVGTVYAVLGFNRDNGPAGLELELFSNLPRTWGDPENWPAWFRVYEGKLDSDTCTRGDARGSNFG